MVVKKLNNFNVENLPESVKENLKVLLRPKGEIVVIGNSLYELYPIPAIKFLEILKDFFEILDNIKQKKIKLIEMTETDETQRQQLLKNVRVEFADILEDEESYNKIIEILKNKVLEGVDEQDFNIMTTPQLVYLINKIIETNINNFPPALREKILPIQTSQNIEDKEVFLKK